MQRAGIVVHQGLPVREIVHVAARREGLRIDPAVPGIDDEGILAVALADLGQISLHARHVRNLPLKVGETAVLHMTDDEMVEIQALADIVILRADQPANRDLAVCGECRRRTMRSDRKGMERKSGVCGRSGALRLGNLTAYIGTVWAGDAPLMSMAEPAGD